MSARDEYISGLRELADLLEANPQLVLPENQFGVMPQNREQMQLWADALSQPKENHSTHNFISIRGHIGALQVSAFGSATKFGRQITRERVTTEYEVEPFLAAAVTT